VLRKLRQAIDAHGLKGAAHLLAKRILGRPTRTFRGAFSSYEEALSDVRSGLLAGYNNDAVVDIAFASMSQVLPADERVLAWMERLLPETRRVLDLGGHMGTKYRAFRQRLNLDGIDWLVYETPAMVRAGRQRALADGLGNLGFIEYEDLGNAPPCQIALASGLLQYLEMPFSNLITCLPVRPPHLILNKVATWDGRTVVMLEDFGVAEVPYQVRNQAEFVKSIQGLGYEILDEWTLPEFSHSIEGAGERSVSRGYYARLRPATI
jgi:putative methyltransferase (TIGR04325 family)